MEYFEKYFGIMCILVTFANGFFLKFRSKKYIAEAPELKEGYKKYFNGLILYGNIPWVIMTIGNISGITKYTFEYFNPGTMNPMVLTFHASIIFLWILSFRWIYFKNGAEFIENHPGFLTKSSFSGNKNITARKLHLMYCRHHKGLRM